VSTATVSRTLSGRGPVSEATRARVLRAVQALQYLPSAAARSLRTQRTMTIGVLVPDLANPVFIPFLRGVQHVAHERGYAVLVVDGQRSLAVEQLALRRLRAQGVDAIVLAGPARDASLVAELRSGGIVVLDPDFGEARGSLLARLERAGTDAMCDALAALGHRRVAYVARERVSGALGQRRWHAMRDCWRGRGVTLERVIVGERRAPVEIGGLIDAVVRRPEPVTALICATHGLAPTLLRGLRAAAVDVPGDCSLVTYGDSEWAEAYRPALSVVAFDLYEVAVAVTADVIAHLDGGLPSQARALLRPARFVPRESTAAARA
jgi:LacI family transcriptional regulator